jgi:hypothetical protein
MRKVQNVFDTFYDKDFSLKSVKGTQYSPITVEDCEIYTNLKAVLPDKRRLKASNIGILQGGILIFFQSSHDSNGNSRPKKYVDINMSYSKKTVTHDKNGNIRYELELTRH